MQGVPCFQAATVDELIKEVPITHSFTRCKPSPGSMQWSAVYRTVFDHLLSFTQHKQPRLSAAVSHVLNTEEFQSLTHSRVISSPCLGAVVSRVQSRDIPGKHGEICCRSPTHMSKFSPQGDVLQREILRCYPCPSSCGSITSHAHKQRCQTPLRLLSSCPSVWEALPGVPIGLSLPQRTATHFSLLADHRDHVKKQVVEIDSA